MEKPKNLHNSGFQSAFSTAINSGKGISRADADSYLGRQITSAKGSILAENELIAKFEALKSKERRPKHGGAKEIARRLKQLNNFQHSIDSLSPTQRTMEAEKRIESLQGS